MPSSSNSSYQDALRRLLSLADYERMSGIAAPAPKADLARMRELAARLGNPQRRVPVVHIAGTKGKGSTASMAAGILAASGRRVGLFTSPHLLTFRERLRVNGEPLSEERFANAIDRIWPHVEAMAKVSEEGTPTTFEALTAMAFELPVSEGVDVLVLEVGLGGRLDSTNVAEAAVDVITSVSLDHTAILGDTIAEIAAEKAGIMKSAVPCITSPQQPEAMQVIERRAEMLGAPLTKIGADATVKPLFHDLHGQRIAVRTSRALHDVWVPLLGTHQAENAAVAVAAVEALDPDIDPQAIVDGLANTQWPGRFQVLPSKGGPTVVVDGAHNAWSMAALRRTVQDYLPSRNTVIVFGCSSDKQPQPMVDEIAPVASSAIACSSRHPRALPADRVAHAFRHAGVASELAPSVAQALVDAQARCGADGAVVVTGSLFVVAEALEAWYGLEPERYPEIESRAPTTGGR